MNVNDRTEHKRIVTARIDEVELKQIIATAVAEKAGFPISDKVEAKVFINSVDRPGTAGVMQQAEVTLTVDVEE